MRTCPRPVAVAAAGAAALLGIVAACPADASEAGGPPGADTTRPGDAVTLTPPTGTAGAEVSVRAECTHEARDGAVFSPAFTQPAVLRPGADGTMVAVATVREGLVPGRGYVVTANCSAAESLTTTFVTAGAAPESGWREADDEPAGGPVDGVALAFGGGLAGIALAGYVLTARRAATRRRLGSSPPSRRR